MLKPRVSILLATYNRSQFLDRAVESARKQTLQDWEMIVIDDGEDEATFEKMTAWAERDPRIRYFRIPRKGRIAVVSNVALEKAQGEYIAILDDDDYWGDPKKLEKQINFLSTHPDYVGCGGGIVTMDKSGKETGKFLKPESDNDIKKNALTANPMANSTTCFRKSTAEGVIRYDETMKQFADWDFWLKMGLRGKLYNFPEYFTHYQMWEEGASFAKQKENAESAIRIVRRYRGKYPRYFAALLSGFAYWLYVHFPEGLKKHLNPLLSRLKKFLFSNRRAN